MSGSRLNRRRLLKGAAAAAAAPYVITSTALGNADTPPASERVTLGHIGVGGQGGYICSRVSSSGARARRAWPWPTPTRTAARPTPG